MLGLVLLQTIICSLKTAPTARQRGAFCHSLFRMSCAVHAGQFRVENDASLLTRIMGVHTFKGSFRRSCHEEPTLGEPKTQLGHSCEGYPGNFSVILFVVQDERNLTTKGYIFPDCWLCRLSTFLLRSIRMTKSLDCWANRRASPGLVYSRSITFFDDYSVTLSEITSSSTRLKYTGDIVEGIFCK